MPILPPRSLSLKALVLIRDWLHLKTHCPLWACILIIMLHIYSLLNSTKIIQQKFQVISHQIGSQAASKLCLCNPKLHSKCVSPSSIHRRIQLPIQKSDTMQHHQKISPVIPTYFLGLAYSCKSMTFFYGKGVSRSLWGITMDDKWSDMYQHLHEHTHEKQSKSIFLQMYILQTS